MTEMSDPSDPRIRVRVVRLFGWRAVIAMVAGLTALVAVAAILALGFLFVVLPAMVLGAVAYYLLSKPPSGSAGYSKPVERTGSTTIIDGTYKVANDATREAGNDHKSDPQPHP